MRDEWASQPEDDAWTGVRPAASAAGATGSGVAQGWAVPGVPLPRPERSHQTGGGDGAVDPGLVPADVTGLLTALHAVLGADPVLLSGPEALERTRLLLRAHEQLAAAVLPALRDVEQRGLWEHAPAGSTRGWLRTLPSGEAGWWTSSTLLARRPHLSAALADGTLALRTARAIASALDTVPAQVPDDQLTAVVTDGARYVLRLWLGAGCLRPTAAQQEQFAARRARLDTAFTTGLAAPDGAPWVVLPQDRLEPVLTLIGQVLPPAEVPTAVGWLLDALLPDTLHDREQQQHEQRGLSLTHRLRGGWNLRGTLEEEPGHLLHALLTAWRTTGRNPLDLDLPHTPRTADATPDQLLTHLTPTASPPTDSTPTGSAQQPRSPDFGAVGPSTPAPDPDPTGTDPWTSGSGSSSASPPGQDQPEPEPAGGQAHRTFGQRQHDAFHALLATIAGLPPGPGRPAPPRLLITATLEALQAHPTDGPHDQPAGRVALPATLHGPAGPIPLSPTALRRLGCTSRLVAVLTDAAGRPVTASRPERDADQGQRDSLRAIWGDRCAVLGCPNPGTVPHHVQPHHRSQHTVLHDLVPLCPSDHHDLHDNHATLRLRDDRTINHTGWSS